MVVCLMRSLLLTLQLVELYGEDARIFLLNCLVKDIDFRGQKDTLKIQLLTHEVAQASSRPNFTTFICEVGGCTASICPPVSCSAFFLLSRLCSCDGAN